MSSPQAIHCYLINLDRSTERLEYFARQFSALGITFERVVAVEGAKIPLVEQNVLIDRVSGKLPVGPGEMGCFLSHREIWKRVEAQPGEWAFIAEDDARFSQDATAFFEADTWIPAGADIVKGETAKQWVTMAAKVDGRPFGHEIRLLESYHGGSAGYFLSKSAAGKLLRLTEDKCDPLDHVLFHEWIGVVDKLRVYQLTPAICIQDYLIEKKRRPVGFRSTLDADRRESRRQFRPVRPSPVRKLWREVSRPFRRMAIRLNRMAVNREGKHVVVQVPIGPLVEVHGS